MVVIERGWAKQRKQTKASYMPPVQTHALTNTQALFQNLNKTNGQAGFHDGDCYSYKSHIGLCEFSLKFWGGAGRGEAALPEPCAEPTLAFTPRPAARKGVEPPAPAWQRWRGWGLWTGRGSLSPTVWAIPAPCSSPAAAAGHRPMPQRAPAARGAGVQSQLGDRRSRGAWFEERDGQTRTRDKQHRAPYTLSTRHKN